MSRQDDNNRNTRLRDDDSSSKKVSNQIQTRFDGKTFKILLTKHCMVPQSITVWPGCCILVHTSHTMSRVYMHLCIAMYLHMSKSLTSNGLASSSRSWHIRGHSRFGYIFHFKLIYRWYPLWKLFLRRNLVLHMAFWIFESCI